MATLDWHMRDALPHLGEKGRLTVLIDLLLRADQLHWRCYPSIKKIAKDTGQSTSVVDAALDWLVEHDAIVKVGYHQRIGKEKKLPSRQSVYQLTGMVTIGEQTYPYLFLNPETWSTVQELVKHSKGHISESEISDTEILEGEISYSETEGITSIKGSAKGKDKKETHSPNGARAVNPHSEMMELVGRIYKFGEQAVLTSNIAAVLRGASKAKGWKEYNVEPPMTTEEATRFFKEYKGDINPQRPINIQAEVYKWRAAVARRQPAPVAPVIYDGDDVIILPDNFFQGILRK